MRTHGILSAAQKCSNPERNIYQATLALKDRIAQLISRGQKGRVVSFDLDHAFDRVDYGFLFRTMCSLGIIANLEALLWRIAEAASSRLMVNGHLSPAFSIERSVRQGDPLSMHLFVLYLHPLLSRLERICASNLVVAYADDISVIVTSTSKLQHIHTLFARFELVSGAKLNLRKTTSIIVGRTDAGGDDDDDVPWLQTANSIKILGVIYVNSIRSMIRQNWDAIVTKFARHVWLHSLRTLSLHQKVVLLNTFITAKIWYISSILPPLNVHVAKITATMGTFLWSRVPARVPMHQLARDRDGGGLGLQLPAMKCKALLLNRHVQEIASIPFYRSFLIQANPIPVNPPAAFPCLKQVCQNFAQLPQNLQQNMSTDLLHHWYVEQQTELPKVQRNNPLVNWRRVWQNIALRGIAAPQRSELYVIVNEKTVHRRLLHIMHRTDGEDCEHCGAAIETVQHKFSECPRVLLAWEDVRRRIAAVYGGWRSLTFSELLRPSLEATNLQQITTILKIFVEFVCFVNRSDADIDRRALEFHLNCI